MPTTNQKDSCDQNCGFSKTAIILGDVWNIYIINLLLQNKELRFGEFIDKTKGLSNSVLSSRLKNLLDYGLIERESIASMPPQVIYSLTKKGMKLKAVFDEINKFGNSAS
jgi:DNA-binding HxlR family transcriptional regulator